MRDDLDTERLSRADAEIIKAVASDARGMAFIAYLIDFCGVNHQSYTPAADERHSAFMEGRRNVALHLLSFIHEDAAREGKYFKAVADRNALRRSDARDSELIKGSVRDGGNGEWIGEFDGGYGGTD